MHWLRLALAPFGGLLGPLVGYSWYLLMRLVNGRRKLIAQVARPPMSTRAVVFYGVPNARLVPRGSDAITFGKRIYVRGETIPTTLLAHELVHVEQYVEHLMLGFFVRYGYQWVRYGYEHMPLETDAVQRARDGVINGA